MCLGATDMGLHHKLCHTLGGAFDLPHAEMHTLLLPHTLAYNSSAVPDAIRVIAAAARVAGAPPGLFDLQRRLGYDERRVGKESGITGRYRWSPIYSKKKTT